MNSSMRKTLDIISIVFLSGIIALAAYWGGSTFFSYDFDKRLKESAQLALNNVDKINSEVVRTLRELNEQPIKGCDDRALTYLRKKLFLLKHVKDLGYLEGDKLICSTGLGTVIPPLIETNPDFVGPEKAEVWINSSLVLFQNEVSAIIVRSGNYNAVLSQDFLADLVSLDTDWEFIFKFEAQQKHIKGTEGLYQSIIQHASEVAQNHNASICSDKIPYCVAITASPSFFFKQYHASLVGCIALAILVFFICYLLFSSMLERYRSVESRVLRGLKNGSFYCLYQPVVELETKKIIGCEVLARFKDKDGELYPDLFIPLIVGLKKTWPFTKSMIKRCQVDLQQFESNAEKFKVNLNFFPQDIDSGIIMELVKDQLLVNDQFQFVVEIIENEQLTNSKSKQVLQDLVNAGFQIAIDDFGTGYSNLRQLKKYNCHILKIDRSFVNEMEDGSIRSTLIPHIIDIAAQVDVCVVAEGIENTQQHQALRELGVPYGQGYMFGRPMSIDRLQGMLL
ncbi:EAL domain-containing protein [Shewanella acanthi]|uniref:EAL domain-containing protein n=1 Tax=Shewanella acanthi TaxID=2864212 RepID=UPI001C65803C|nr:EAL domain-containing protein [Shewanella acanthi]QYJ77375.1 EAL domain-containing protein [Shewanella acanthi]